MGSPQGTTLNTDSDAKRTSSEYGDRGDGTSRWYQWRRTADGGDVTAGATADAAVTSPTAAGSLVALLKGLLTFGRTSAVGVTSTAANKSATSAVVTNAAASAALGAVAARTNYVTGIEVTGTGATAAGAVTVTLAGTIGGTLNYVLPIPAGADVAITPLILTFWPPLQGAAANAAVTLTAPAFGAGNTRAAAVIHGFDL